ncbi:unnamed protein product [Paramecium sonneborni]|uniref:Uncharacterized protein n=1 Tax=Paramecium sonneborni TaxID=65129 RepID=A0A8S1R3K4_9CILI|nr:unnamed protein product [Paramecium sonneborni]
MIYLNVQNICIYTNFVNLIKSYIKPIKFNNWITVISRFLGTSAIKIISNRISCNNKTTEKVSKNTYNYIEFTQDQYITNKIIDVFL